MTRPDDTPLTAALDLFERSCEGRCANPRCPSEHIDYAPDCVEFARAHLRATLDAASKPGLDVETVDWQPYVDRLVAENAQLRERLALAENAAVALLATLPVEDATKPVPANGPKRSFLGHAARLAGTTEPERTER